MSVISNILVKPSLTMTICNKNDSFNSSFVNSLSKINNNLNNASISESRDESKYIEEVEEIIENEEFEEYEEFDECEEIEENDSDCDDADDADGILLKNEIDINGDSSETETCDENGQYDYEVQMEHSYSRDCRPITGANGLKTRTLMVHRPPQCPSCHAHPLDEGGDLDDTNQPPFPTYNETIANELMNECTRIAQSVRNENSDDVNWENCVNKTGWSYQQDNLFSKVSQILDHDHLARLATMGKQHEAVHKRIIIDKSAQRIRKVFAGISWESRLTQWLHSLLMENLPPLYMASYLDIMQTLKSKLPSLLDKIIFGKPININQELMVPVIKPQWDPIIITKQRTLPKPCAMILIPSNPGFAELSTRMQKWVNLFSSIAQVFPINTPVFLSNENNESFTKFDFEKLRKKKCTRLDDIIEALAELLKVIDRADISLNNQPLENVAEQIAYLAKIKIHELKADSIDRHITLVGFNAGAAIALQVALSESVNTIISVGLACNTINGYRGAPDDRILDITVPIMFIVGQNSAKSSQEEMESLREKMISETSLVVVGSADEMLRIPKSKRQIESATQSMVDSMVTDEVWEFIKKCTLEPPAPRTLSQSTVGTPILSGNISQARKITGPQNLNVQTKKRKHEEDGPILPKKHYNKGTLKSLQTFKFQDPLQVKRKVGRPRTRPINTPSTLTPKTQLHTTKATDDIIQSSVPSLVLDERQIESTLDDNREIMNSFEIITNTSPLKTLAGGQQSLPQVATIQTPQQRITSNPKIKMVPSNQFVHLKPSLQSQSKIYTIKPSEPQRQFYTIKNQSQNQYQKQKGLVNQVVLSPQKFTVLKSGTNNVINAAATKTSGGFQELTTAADLSSANIFDIPIVFADNDGILHDASSITSVSSTHSTEYSQQAIQPQLNQNTGSLKPPIANVTSSVNKQNSKVVFINRNTMKPCPNIISKSSTPAMKYTKVVVTNPKTSMPCLVTRAGSGNTSISAEQDKNSVVTTTLPKSGVINLKTNQLQQQKFQQKPIKQFHPIIVNLDSERAKSMIKIDASQIVKSSTSGTPTIFVKQPSSSAIKPIHLIQQGENVPSINRNITIKPVAIQTKTLGSSTSNQINQVKITTTKFIGKTPYV